MDFREKIRQYKFYQKFWLNSKKGNHTYKGSLTRHKAVEKVLYFLRRHTTRYINNFTRKFNKYLYRICYIPYHFFFGLNCNFPIKDIITFIRFWICGYEINEITIHSKPLFFEIFGLMKLLMEKPKIVPVMSAIFQEVKSWSI